MYQSSRKLCIKGGINALAVVLALFAFMPAAHASIQYSGSISTPTDLVGAGQWASGATLSWRVTDNSNGTWNYWYQFSHPDPETSHITFEISTNVTDLDDPLLRFENLGDGTPVLEQGGAPSNPNLPGNFTDPLKFDGTDGTTTIIEFNIARVPTWGDFYAKGGNNRNLGTAYNSGFLQVDPDPVSYPLQNGPLYINGLAHILVPDSLVPPPPPGNGEVPEAASVAVWTMLAGCAALVASRRRRAA